MIHKHDTLEQVPDFIPFSEWYPYQPIFHYTGLHKSPIRLKPVTEQPYYRIKPEGFWVSIDIEDMGWKSWCESEQWNLKKIQCKHKVSIDPAANILVITNYEELHKFTLMYLRRADETVRNSMTFISWDLVAKKYDGIIISPYIGIARLQLKFAWYYGWDCASGCIWNTDVITAIERVSNDKTLS